MRFPYKTATKPPVTICNSSSSCVQPQPRSESGGWGGALRGHCYVHAITSPGQRLIVRQRRFNQGPSFSSAILRRRPSECSTSATNRRRTNFRDRKTKKLNRKTSWDLAQIYRRGRLNARHRMTSKLNPIDKEQPKELPQTALVRPPLNFLDHYLV